MTTTISGTSGVSQVQDNIITTAKIVDANVTTAKLTGLTITTSQTTPLPAVNTSITYTHGLGSVPISAELEIVCLTAEQGYSVGDVVVPLTMPTGTAILPFGIYKNATTVSARTGANTAWVVVNITTGVTAAITAANWAWRYKVRVA